MKYRISNRQNSILRDAVEKAKGHGSCEYVVNDCPQCVIAQVHNLEGGATEDMTMWIHPNKRGAMGVEGVMKQHKPITLLHYSNTLLGKLQTIWDNDLISEVDARLAMRWLLNSECEVVG